MRSTNIALISFVLVSSILGAPSAHARDDVPSLLDACPPCDRATADGGEDSYEVRACVDLDNDGQVDALRGWPSARWGNGGGGVGFWLRGDDEPIDEIQMHTAAVHFEPGAPGEGFVSVYHRSNASSGVIRRYRVAERTVTLVEERHSDSFPTYDDFEMEYSRLFRGSAALDFEEGRCESSEEDPSGELVWRPLRPRP